MKNLITFGSSSQIKDIAGGNKLNQSVFGKYKATDRSINIRNMKQMAAKGAFIKQYEDFKNRKNLQESSSIHTSQTRVERAKPTVIT